MSVWFVCQEKLPDIFGGFEAFLFLFFFLSDIGKQVTALSLHTRVRVRVSFSVRFSSTHNMGIETWGVSEHEGVET